MAAITTRQTAGTGATVAGVPLTNTQLDTNFINLNTELASAASTSGSYSNPAWITALAETKVLPTQTGNSGKFLSTNGTTTSWADTNPSQTGNSGKFLSTNGTITSWSDVLPSQTSNSGKFLTTNGTTSSWAFAGISQVTTATTATTLTNTPMLLQITPADYGVTVTLPDATTCTVGGPLHCIDNRGGFPVRVVNTSGTLLGFVYAGVVSYISLDNNSTAAGVWAISSNESVGRSAKLLTTNLYEPVACIDIGSSQEVLIGFGNSSSTSTNVYGVVYNRATNTFGSVTLIRTGTFSTNLVAAVLSGANQVMVVSTPSGEATFEAVTLSISGTTITVNTAAIATLSSNISGNGFANGCGLIAVGSSFVTSYRVDTPACQIRALTVSGTTVTIGSASVLSGTAGGLVAASSSVVIAVSTATTSIYTTPYTVSGSTLTVGTGTTTTSSTMTLDKLAALGTRWYVGYNDGGSTVKAGVVTLSGTTTTISTVTLLSSGTITDAIVVGSNKVLVLSDTTSSNANILTDTAGTASAGTAITLSSLTTRVCAYVNGTTAYVIDAPVNNSQYAALTIDCSGASPVLSGRQSISGSHSAYNFASGVSNSVLAAGTGILRGDDFYSPSMASPSATVIWYPQIRGGQLVQRTIPFATEGYGSTSWRGKSNKERWATDFPLSVITKVECV